MAGKKRTDVDPATQAFNAGWDLVSRHPMFRPIRGYTSVRRDGGSDCPPNGLGVVLDNGILALHPTRRATADTWAFAVAHLLCHLGFGHVATIGPASDADPYDQAAACFVVNRFLAALKLTVPSDALPAVLLEGDEFSLAGRWRQLGGTPPDVGLRPGPRGCVDQIHRQRWGDPIDYPRLFALGLTAAATAAVDVAGGARATVNDLESNGPRTPWDRALAWFVSSYPLLGALATGLRVIADAEVCRQLDIQVAAVSTYYGRIYVNPHAQHSSDEWRFILAHEMLHAGLRHSARVGGRDHYLFNIAADYQINGWLVEMEVGALPPGALYDPELKGLSAEAIYDRITTDLRRNRKLMTLRGAQGKGEHAGDLLGPDVGVNPTDGTDLDAFYRSALGSGLSLHRGGGRGLVPAGLVEEIEALDMPALAWDAQLARWFEEFVTPPEPIRSYARPSRRQSSTPDIPRAGRVFREEVLLACTFGVVLDTSGSMAKPLLAKALGSIASFAASRDVPAARVVFCDAAAYDAGYLPTSEIAGRVRVRGRGGTELQPGIDLLERAADFPRTGPILIITDGQCDVVRVRREHAFLVPVAALLPFTPRGPVFRMS